MTTTDDGPVVDATAMRAWRTFLRAHAVVTRRLEADLVEGQDLPLSWYDVLVQLAEAPDRSLRMSELAGQVMLSRSGLSRLVDRLVREGLLERRAYPDDARGTLAVLTPCGLDRLRTAAPTHLAGVQRYATGAFTPQELDTLADLLGRIAGPEPADRRDTGCGADS